MKWFAIFKTGQHTDSSGNQKEWSEKDLDKIVENYDPSKHEAPIVIGHPKTNAPAFGWVEKLKRIGDTLYAFPKQLAQEFVDMVNKGLFKKRSVSLYPDGTLRHVGFLGAMPPAIKGLPDVEFKEGENAFDYELEFAEINIIEDLQSQISTLQEKLFKYQELEQKIKNYEEVNQKLESITNEKNELENRLKEISTKLQQTEFEEFIDKKIEQGKLLPKQRDAVIKIYNEIYLKSDPNQDTQKLFKEFFEEMPKIIEFEETKIEPKGKKNQQSSATIVAEEIRKNML